MEGSEKTARPDLEQLIAAPPGGDDGGEPGDSYAMLELALDFPRLSVVPERHALWMRLFVVTRDPLDWIADRAGAWAVLQAGDTVFELSVYIDLATIQRALAAGEQLEPVLGRYGETALRRTLEHELLLSAGEDTPLLAGLDEHEGRFGVPDVRVQSPDWEPIGLGAVQDLVRDAFGDVALDRSPVKLAPVDPEEPECPACDGMTFGFPTDLERAAEQMCDAHRAAAVMEQTARLARARESNPAGWRAIDKAAARVSGEPEPVFAPQPRRSAAAVARNDPCPCGSGLKYKRCHGA